MTSSSGRAAAPEQSNAHAGAEIGWRIANPLMCALIGLIAGGASAAAIGLVAGAALVAAPSVWPHLARGLAQAWSWLTPRLPIVRDRFLSYLPAALVRVLVGEGRGA